MRLKAVIEILANNIKVNTTDQYMLYSQQRITRYLLQKYLFCYNFSPTACNIPWVVFQCSEKS